VNADAIAFQLNAGEVVNGEVAERVRDRCHTKTTTKIVATNKVAVARRRLSLVNL